MKRFSVGVLIGLMLAGLFAAPWMYQAWAVGSCSVFRTWNTGDTVTAGDLNSSFTTAAVTNSTPQCLDDFSANVSQMQSTADPYPSGTESLATSTAEELERLRFMLKQIFGLTHWYRHDEAPNFSAGHVGIAALHLGSSGVPGGTDAQQNAQLARFPVLTGPDHWTGIFWPHNTAHMAISIRDANHAAGGVQGGIERFRFHAGGLTLHHTAALRFQHSLVGNGATTHVTALSIDGKTDQLILGHASATIRIQGNGISGGSGQVLFVAADGQITSEASGGFRSIQVFTSNDTWTRPAGIRLVVIEAVGGGGAGGGAAATVAGDGAAGGGGGGGGYARKILNVSSVASSTITVGAGGTAGTAGAVAGNTGGASSWSDGVTTVTANGGVGGSGSLSATLPIAGGAGGAGGTSTGGDVNSKGGAGHGGFGFVNGVHGGTGGSSVLGGGGQGLINNTSGAAGGAFGGGGSGAAGSNTVALSGSAGAAGIVIVTEYE